MKQNVTQCVGNTPIVVLNRCVPQSQHTFLAKLEFMNPGGSVKDRMALSIIESAEAKGLLKPGSTIVEATSGNTGVGLAMVAAVKGYKCVFTMPAKMSGEKVQMLKAYGAEVITTPTGVAPEDPRSHYSVARKIAADTPNSFLANQYNNPDNPRKHFETTGPEIWEQTKGKVDVFVGGAGTGGTLTGTAKFLKSKNPKVKVVVADPKGSILHDLFYYKEVRSAMTPYEVEGIGEDMVPDNVQFNFYDDFIETHDKESFGLCRDIVRKEGLFVGPSSGAALEAAIKYSQKLTTPHTFVVLFPDSGSRYLSKVFNDEWMQQKGLL